MLPIFGGIKNGADRLSERESLPFDDQPVNANHGEFAYSISPTLCTFPQAHRMILSRVSTDNALEFCCNSAKHLCQQ